MIYKRRTGQNELFLLKSFKEIKHDRASELLMLRSDIHNPFFGLWIFFFAGFDGTTEMRSDKRKEKYGERII